MNRCIKCEKKLLSEETALHKKLISRAAKEFLCKECLAEYFGCSVSLLDEKIEQFRQIGCVLFK